VKIGEFLLGNWGYVYIVYYFYLKDSSFAVLASEGSKGIFFPQFCDVAEVIIHKTI
jgi:hypothetical protein